MASPGTQSGIIRFGPFDLDPANRELRKRGNVIKLRLQQVAVLLLLVERAGQIVSRKEIHQYVWGNDTFVDFERGINFAINQIRAALGDEAGDPRFIETIHAAVIASLPRSRPMRREKRVLYLPCLPVGAKMVIEGRTTRRADSSFLIEEF